MASRRCCYFILTTDLPLSVIVGRINEGMSHFILLTIPLFIFLGVQIQYTGMAKSMVDFFVAIFGGIRGGLGYVLLVRDVPGFGHFRCEGRRHGGDRADPRARP